jgi:PKD repeat protein
MAHWCDTLWKSDYNIVVRPSTDTVTVPSGGTASVDLWAQNNMGYPLENFGLSVGQMPSGYTRVSLTRAAPTFGTYLMPGERVKYTLTVSKSSGVSAPMLVEGITFGITFGAGQSSGYGKNGGPVVIKKKSGALYPAKPLDGLSDWPNTVVGQGEQAWAMTATADADFGPNQTSRYGSLLRSYCAGRGSWSGTSSDETYCPDNLATTCAGNGGTSSGSVNDFEHLWSAPQMAVRKSGMTSGQLAAFRERLKCGSDDGHLAFSGMALFVLGYLGEDPSARIFLQSVVANGCSGVATLRDNEKLIAKAALILMRNSQDASYKAEVQAGMNNANVYVAGACQAAIAIVEKDDTAVTASNRLLARARWRQPDTEGGGPSLWAAHMLSMVAWDRRQWAPDAEEQGTVSFYGEGPVVVDTVPPKAPTGVACTYDAYTDGRVQVAWQQVTQDTNNVSEGIQKYTVSYGYTSSNGQLDPQVFTYDHATDTGTTTSRTFTSTDWADPARRSYVAVTAWDLASNRSRYSTEIACIPHYHPVAQLSCSPTSGDAPLTVSCNSTGTSDPNASLDTLTYAFQLNSASSTLGTTAQYSNLQQGTYTVLLTVTDSTSLTSTKTASITVTNPNSQNHTPTAVVALTDPSGAPFRVGQGVGFTSAGTNDQDGDALTFSWNFGDGSTSTQANPTHTYQSSGSFNVVLQVTDNGSPALSATASLAVNVVGNHAPSASDATADPLVGEAPLPVTFDASRVTDPEGDSVTFTWKFGDGSPDQTGTVINHTYAAAGSYSAQLVATDQATPTPASATKTFTITVGSVTPSNQAPDCSSAKVTPLSGKAPLTITMDASGCADPEGASLTYSWRVSIATTKEENFSTAAANYVLQAAGTYPVNLVVSDGSNETPKRFDVQVLPGNSPDGKATWDPWGCSAAAGATPVAGLLTMLALSFALRRRRR